MLKKIMSILIFYLVFGCVINAEKFTASNTWVFVYGILKWADKKTYTKFENTDRVDNEMVELFKKKGVPNNQILYLKDYKAGLDDVKKKLIEFLRKSKNPKDTLIFYYSGHGYLNEQGQSCIVPYYGEEWSANEIMKTVYENFRGDNAIFLTECCNSGEFSEEAEKYHNRYYASLNSITKDKTSTGNWTFSKCVLYGFEGKSFIPRKKSSEITLNDLAQYIDIEMAKVDRQKADYSIPATMTNWIVADNVPAITHPRVGEHVNVEYSDPKGKKYDWLGFIESYKNKKFLVRFYSYTNDETDLIDEKDLKTVNYTEKYPIGSSVKAFCDDEKKWFPAKILKYFCGLYYVHYKNYSSKYDEWVPSEDIKIP